MSIPLLLYGNPLKDLDIYWGCRFSVLDTVILLIRGKEKILYVSDLEIDRARIEAKVTEVRSFTRLKQIKGKSASGHGGGIQQTILQILQLEKISTVQVSGKFPVSIADYLRSNQVKLALVMQPLFAKRAVKNGTELKYIKQASRAAVKGIELARLLISQADIYRHELWYDEEPLTSDRVRIFQQHMLLQDGYFAEDTIISCGADSALPHHRGSGVLRINEPIIVDIFPASLTNYYHSDMTRTFVRGKPNPIIERMHASVLKAQQKALRQVKAGADGKVIHQLVERILRQAGFETKATAKGMQGFFHGTGHGVGLEVHEAPSINSRGSILKTNNVVTVEPGLYYPGVGGIRIEDLVVVKAEGAEILTGCDYELLV